MADLICVGAIAGAFGVDGAVRLKSFCAEPGDIGSYGPLATEDGGRCFEVVLEGPITSGFSARLSGISTREAADALKGTRLHAPRERLPDPGDEEFYHADLVGLDVVDTGGARFGRVRAVQNHGASDILEIEAVEGGALMLLPFTRAVFPNVDLRSGRIIVDPPQDTPT